LLFWDPCLWRACSCEQGRPAKRYKRTEWNIGASASCRGVVWARSCVALATVLSPQGCGHDPLIAFPCSAEVWPCLKLLFELGAQPKPPPQHAECEQRHEQEGGDEQQQQQQLAGQQEGQQEAAQQEQQLPQQPLPSPQQQHQQQQPGPQQPRTPAGAPGVSDDATDVAAAAPLREVWAPHMHAYCANIREQVGAGKQAALLWHLCACWLPCAAACSSIPGPANMPAPCIRPRLWVPGSPIGILPKPKGHQAVP